MSEGEMSEGNASEKGIESIHVWYEPLEVGSEML